MPLGDLPSGSFENNACFHGRGRPSTAMAVLLQIGARRREARFAGMRRSCNEAEDVFGEADLFSDVTLCQPSNLSFADHVHCFVALDRSLRARELTETEARLDPPFDRTVILLDNAVEV